MAVLSTTTKGKLGVKTAKGLAKHRALRETAVPVAKLAFQIAKPLAKRRASRQLKRAQEAAQTIGTALAVYGPEVAYELGLAEPPRPKRTGPRVLVGVVLGASLVYFLEPGTGREHRRQVMRLVS